MTIHDKDFSIHLDPMSTDFYRDAAGNILQNAEIEKRYNRMAAALKSIALSYPTTEEGAWMAAEAQEALK